MRKPTPRGLPVVWGLREGSPRTAGRRALYLEVVLAVDSEPVAEHIPGDHHVGLDAVHGQAVHAQELRQKGAAVTLHYELEPREEGRAAEERMKTPGRPGEPPPQAQTLPGSRASRPDGPVKSWGFLGLREAMAHPPPPAGRAEGEAGRAGQGPVGLVLLGRP